MYKRTHALVNRIMGFDFSFRAKTVSCVEVLAGPSKTHRSLSQYTKPSPLVRLADFIPV